MELSSEDLPAAALREAGPAFSKSLELASEKCSPYHVRTSEGNMGIPPVLATYKHHVDGFAFFYRE